MIHFDVHLEKGERFKVLRTTERLQIAMMTLPPGGASIHEEGNATSDHTVYVIEGRIELTVGDEKRELRAGEGAIIPASTAFTMKVVGRRSSTLFNLYGPPAYPAEAESADWRSAGLGERSWDRPES